MKRLSATVVSAAFVTVIGVAILIVATVYKQRQPMHVEVVGDSDVDFGELEEGGIFNHTFVLVNRSGSPLKITEIVPGCGCTSAVADRRELAAGGSANIDVAYRTRPVSTPENIQIVVGTDDPQRRWLVLRMHGSVRLIAYAEPKTVSLRAAQGDKLAASVVRLKTRGEIAWKVGQVSASSSRLAVQIIDGNENAVRIAVSDDCELGNWSEVVTVRLESGDKVRTLAIPVFVTLLKVSR